MPINPWEIPINSETTRENLELVAHADDRTSDSNAKRAAANARAELWRRDQKEWADRFEAQERARVLAQKFQEAQNTRLVEAQERVATQQIEIAQKSLEAASRQVEAAEKQAAAAERSVLAAIKTANATKALVWATALLVLLAAIQIGITFIARFS